MSATSWQKNLVTQAGFEFSRSTIPTNRMKFGDTLLVQDDGVISFYCDKTVIESPVMECAEADSVFQFVSPALVVNRNDVRCIHEVELDSADSAAIAVSRQNVLAEACVTHLSIDLLQHRFSWSGRYVVDLAFNVGIGNALKLVHFFRLLCRLMQFFEFLNIGRQEIGAERDGDFLIVASLRKKRFRLCFVYGFAPDLERRRPAYHGDQMLGNVEPREYLFSFFPSKQKRFRAFFDAKMINACYLNPQFVRISRIAAVCQVPDIAEGNGSLIATEKRHLKGML